MGQQTKLSERMKKTLQVLQTQLHIGLWKSVPQPDRRWSNRTWYICLNWQDRNAKNGQHRQVVLSEKFAYQTARTIALKLGKKCNLPVFQYKETEDFSIIGVSAERTNALDARRYKNALRELRQAKKITDRMSVL